MLVRAGQCSLSVSRCRVAAGPGEVVTPSSDKVQSSAASCWAAAKPSFALGPDVNSRPARSRQPIKRLSLARVPPVPGPVTPRHVSPPRHHDQLFSPRLPASPVFTPIFVPHRHPLSALVRGEQGSLMRQESVWLRWCGLDMGWLGTGVLCHLGNR